MGDIQTRPFSKNYSGLINQSVIGIGIAVLCVSGHELMKRRRRGKALLDPPQGLGAKESWEFGYLYQGRSWARFPSPPTPTGWPLSWVKEAINFPEEKINELRGLDAALYIRFLRGCFWFALTHSLTTFPILFPIHVRFSDSSVSSKSMTRASISSLVGTATGRSLLWIHICLLFWVTLTWITTLFWICNGAFRLRAATLRVQAQRSQDIQEGTYQEDSTYHKHPHPQYGFRDSSTKATDNPTRGLRLRTIMVTNIPSSLRNEKDLQEYFQYYMSRKVEKPSMGLTSSTQPGFLNKSFAFLFNRAKRLPAHLPTPLTNRDKDSEGDEGKGKDGKQKTRASLEIPRIERVVIVRKMTELASLLERREDILSQLEAAHIKLANKALLAVKAAMEKKDANKSIAQCTSRALEVVRNKRKSLAVDAERGQPQQEGTLDEEERVEELIEVLGPFVEEFGTQRSLTTRSKKAVSRTSRQAFKKIRNQAEDSASEQSDNPASYPPSPTMRKRLQTAQYWTIWDALLSLPRDSLDAYQPLVNLSHLFRGRTVPSIDYYTAKLNLLTALVIENRAKAVTDYDAVSTAFVTFVDPADARRACKYLAVHPNNPLACLVTMAPMYSDIDWTRMMKSTYKAEFVKDWVVNIGVWGFTLFWLFPVSLLVGLVSIQNISLFWPRLKAYLDHHAWQSEVLQSFIPTLLVALLAILIPLILLLIAKKAHTITTLSALHDLIMTRYYKFLIVNVLVFFCVGTAAMQSFLLSFRSTERPNVIRVVADSFPTAGPFYVGWLIFTTAMHGGFELALLGLPLIMYPTTKRQTAPRKRTVGVRPRTFNFYYWLPNHTLVIHVLLLFSIFNPFVLPFGSLYFFIQSGVVKNQLIHVYAKNYEGDGRVLMIRMVRYSLDGLVLAQAVFLAYMVVLKKTTNVGLATFLIVLTALTKLMITRMIRAQYELDDILEADIICNGRQKTSTPEPDSENEGLINSVDVESSRPFKHHKAHTSALTWKLPAWVNFSYSTMQRRGNRQRRAPNPFGPHVISDDRVIPRQILESSAKGEEEKSPSPDTPTIRLVTRSQTWSPRSRRRPSMVLDIGPAQQDPLPVVPHPPLISWDDQNNLDLPYDNPYYTRTIENVLWLPRNPTCVLDLDDTVDLKVSITVEVAAGQLGTWMGLPETASPDEMSVNSKPESLAPFASTSALSTTSPLFPSLSLPEVDGTEEIDLPPTIARRISSKEDDVDRVIRPRKSIAFTRKASMNHDKVSVNALSTGTRRRPSMLEVKSQRSFSDTISPGRPRSASILSTLQVPPSTGLPLHVPSSDQEFGSRPDAHAQAEFVVNNNSASGLSVPGQRRPRTPNVSAAQAIFHEVLEEERQALIDRLEDETAEEQAQNNSSWLTSWMFKKAE